MKKKQIELKKLSLIKEKIAPLTTNTKGYIIGGNGVARPNDSPSKWPSPCTDGPAK